jgi:hypothetical protein
MNVLFRPYDMTDMRPGQKTSVARPSIRLLKQRSKDLVIIPLKHSYAASTIRQQSVYLH